MSFTLTTEFDDTFTFKGKVYNVDMSFDNILLLFEMFDDKELYQAEKIEYTLEILVEDYESLEFDSYEELSEFYKYLLREFLDIDLDKISQKSDSEEPGVKQYDFVKDAELIYASFFAVYRMDLFELRGKLHWRKFQALLSHLDENSPFKKAIGYRVMSIPDEKKVGKEYRSHVIKMKDFYSLEDISPHQKMDNAFNALSSILKGGGKHGGRKGNN